ncbi:LuxR family transcriptional regulator [Catenulispora yoronensis]|uniref:LuxR family transcriptional regulator n=1 Tax=Catenulispora yoronensis TaxID=450799 RepID=A0ABP5GBK6_9ACTN
MLGVIGLDCLSEQVYRVLLDHPRAGIDELAERLAVPVARIRECLATLERLELLRASRETPGGLRPVSPRVGLEVLVRRQELDLVRRRQELARGQVAAAGLVADFAGHHPPAGAPRSRLLLGVDAVQSRLEELAQPAADILAVVPGPGPHKDVLEGIQPIAAAVLERGAQVRVLAQDAMTANRDSLDHARRLTKAGGHVRTAPVLPSPMFAVDARIAVVPVVPVDPADTAKGAVEVTEPGVVAALVAGFDYAWSRAVALDTACPPGPDGRPSDADLELLALLGTGLTDEAIANRLGVSLRTVRRRVSDLMGRLEATGRFDAGRKAVLRGWL